MFIVYLQALLNSEKQRWYFYEVIVTFLSEAKLIIQSVPLTQRYVSYILNIHHTWPCEPITVLHVQYKHTHPAEDDLKTSRRCRQKSIIRPGYDCAHLLLKSVAQYFNILGGNEQVRRIGVGMEEVHEFSCDERLMSILHVKQGFSAQG